MQTLISQLLNQSRSPDQTFIMVVVPDDAPPTLEQFDSVELLQARIGVLLEQDVHLFPFLGTRLGISKGPNRHLITPFGVLPLYTIPNVDQLELEDDGFVGKSRDIYQAPQSAAEPTEAVEGDEDDEADEHDEPGDQGGQPQDAGSSAADDDDSVAVPPG